jgi:hypothetical protein
MVEAADDALRFEIREAQARNYSYRRGAVAAHLLSRSGASPRILVAFPAGNSGMAIWLERWTVGWSWLQALLAEGLARPLRRNDLDAETRALVARAEGALWNAIEGAAEVQNAELWSWEYDPADGYRVAPFGQASDHHDESNAAQLWSTAYLSVQRRA